MRRINRNNKLAKTRARKARPPKRRGARNGRRRPSQIDESKKADELPRFAAQLQATLNVIPAHTFYTTPSGGLTFVNKRTADYLGLPEDHPMRLGIDIGAPWDAHNPFLHPDDQEETLKIWAMCLRTGVGEEARFRIRSAQGDYRWFLSRSEPLRASDGTILFWVGVNWDIEDRTQALARLQQLQSDFAHMNRLSMMGELAASLAHEIKQPIAAARTHASAAMRWLDRSLPDPGEAKKALAGIVDSANRANDIIDRIRDQIKKAPPQKKGFDLSEAINEVIKLARSQIIENRVSVQTRLAEGAPAIHGDRVQLQQVLLNLILNAVEAMGSVEAGPRELSISAEQDHTGVLVTVRDSGPGIDASCLERVFEPFYTTKSSGTGMGLSICRSIIDAHGGRLWAGANEPRGTVFRFTLSDASGR
jgi:PAS domain S-box-containing protein